MQRFRFGVAVLALALFLPAVWARGQASTGNMYGTVTDESGGVLPGVSVTISGQGAPQTTFTDTRGEFHFLNLSVGAYNLNVQLQGFTTVERQGVVVNLGQNTNVTIPLKISSVSATITVSGETPVIDQRQATTGANFQLNELKEIPTGRDPWVIMNQVPGVQMDRLNVAGNQSGQQSVFIGMGTDSSQNAFNMDGVTITDMSALGSSPAYYDFDQFQEIQVATGGTDPSIAVPGVTLNMVTKRGTNEPHGSARYFYSPGELQAHNLPQEAKDQGFTNAQMNHICTIGCKGAGAGIQDYGVEAGGALWKDKAWLWGSYGRKEIPLTAFGGASDTTYLDDYAGKLNLQPIESNSATVFYFRGGKSKFGRSASSTRPQETSVDQTGPTVIWKGEDSQVFGTSFVLDASYDYTAGGFSLTPEGGNLTPTTNVYLDPNLIYHRSFIANVFNRPQHQVNANMSYFFNTGALGHEIKAGFGYRTTPISSSAFWPGNGIFAREQNIVRGTVCPQGSPCTAADITRPSVSSSEYKYTNAFIGDTITANNLTVNLGVRYDYQYGINLPSSVPANPLFPDLVPALTGYQGNNAEFKWKNFQPRVGVNYALGAEKRTLLRASYARYADQLGGSIVPWDNPTFGGGPNGVRVVWHDLNHDHNVQPNEIGAVIQGIGGFDPNNPNSVSSLNVLDPNLKAPLTDEIQFGVEHQLLPDFGVGLTGTYRHRSKLLWSPWIGVTAADYQDVVATNQPGYDINGNIIGFTGNIYGSAAPGLTGGEFVTNRPDYAQNYYGVTLQATKRLSNKWMMHGSFAYNDWKQDVKNAATACIDPTNQRLAQDLFYNNGNPLPFSTGPSCGSGQVYNVSLGSGGFNNVFINSHWSVNVSGLYQLPWNFNVAANFFGRQGYLNPAFIAVDTGNGEGTRTVLLGSPEDYRLKNVYELDMRVEKVVPLFQRADLTLSIDVFNVLNSNTILQRQGDATPIPTVDQTQPCNPSTNPCVGNYGTIAEVQNARALRFGARISF